MQVQCISNISMGKMATKPMCKGKRLHVSTGPKYLKFGRTYTFPNLKAEKKLCMKGTSASVVV